MTEHVNMYIQAPFEDAPFTALERFNMLDCLEYAEQQRRIYNSAFSDNLRFYANVRVMCDADDAGLVQGAFFITDYQRERAPYAITRSSLLRRFIKRLRGQS